MLFSAVIIEDGFAINEQDTHLFLYDLLEKALTENPSNLLKLQRVYYHPVGKTARDIQLSAVVTLVMNEIFSTSDINITNYCPMLRNCSEEYLLGQKHWYCRNYFSFVLSLYSNNDDESLQIADLVGINGYDTFKIFDPSFSFVMGTLAIPQFLNVLFRESLKDDNKVELYFSINELGFPLPDYDEICDALTTLLVWVSVYMVTL